MLSMDMAKMERLALHFPIVNVESHSGRPERKADFPDRICGRIPNFGCPVSKCTTHE
jgi:hypothetical protein